MRTRQPIADLEAERAVIGLATIHPGDLDEAAGVLEESDFAHPAHRAAWRAILGLYRRGQALDTLALRRALEADDALRTVGGDEGLLALTEPPLGVQLASALRAVREIANVRRMAEACMSVAAEAYERPEDPARWLDQAEARVFEVAHGARAQSDRLRPLRAAVTEAVAAFFEAARRRKQGGSIALTTGLVDLDERLGGGLRPGQLVIVAGRPGSGKSALAGGMAAAAARPDGGAVPVHFASLEMTADELAARVIAAEGHVDLESIRTGTVTHSVSHALDATASEVATWPIEIDDTPGQSLLHVRSKARRIAARHGRLGLIVVDYLQLMRAVGRHDSREQAVAEVSRGLKELAKELAVPVVALAQLNRESEKRKDRRPMLSDLRESGSIEQDADAIVFVYRDDLYNPDSPDAGQAELIIAKQRSGPTGTVKVRYDAKQTAFRNLERNSY